MDIDIFGDRGAKLGLYCEHLPPNCEGDIVNIDGRRVCDECCDHTRAYTGVLQWNGLTYCIQCCKHTFKHKSFICNLGDGFDTCTLCFQAIGRHIEMPPRRSGRFRKFRFVIPKITLTDCDGVVRRANKG